MSINTMPTTKEDGKMEGPRALVNSISITGLISRVPSTTDKLRAMTEFISILMVLIREAP